jgi:transposase
MRVAPAVILDGQQRKTLERWAKSGSLPMRQVQRAQIILLAADGKHDLEIAGTMGISNQKAARWRKRFLQKGFSGLEKDASRPGRRRTISPARIQEVVRKTTQEKPQNSTHWSTRTMAKAAGLSEKSVRRIWQKHGLKPHLVRTFKVSNDLQFAEKLEANRRPLSQSARTRYCPLCR